jgi:DNA polymerase-3 subunit delta
MIIKSYQLEKNFNNKINFYLLYGNNFGHINETIKNFFEPKFSKNIYKYEELEILENSNFFLQSVKNKSFFENDKLIIINRASDKTLNIIEELIDINSPDLKIIIKTGVLEKKSKLRNFFEKNKDTIIIPYYEDNQQTLIKIAQQFFYENKIKVNHEIINHIIKKVVGDRGALKNELEKIKIYSGKKTVNLREISKIINLHENYKISELTDFYLQKKNKQVINILNENNSSIEDDILIIKSFLFKLKRLKTIKKKLELQKNLDIVLDNYKPSIFWKDKEILKTQIKNFSTIKIKLLIKKINELELLVKKNSQISNKIIYNFILETL